MLKWYLFRLLCCRRNDSGEICNNKVLNAVAQFAITWCHSQPKTLTTCQGPPAGRMSVAPLADCPEKCRRTTPCSTWTRDLFRCGWLGALQQANKTPRTFLLTVPHRAYSQYQARIHLERNQQAARLNWTFSRNPCQLLNEVLFVGLDFGKRELKAPESATKIICKDKLFYRANHTGGMDGASIQIFETQRSRRLQRRNKDERKRRSSAQMTPLAAALSSSRCLRVCASDCGDLSWFLPQNRVRKEAAGIFVWYI